jgi:hypothetical protein
MHKSGKLDVETVELEVATGSRIRWVFMLPAKA